jgi:hypothetical protein
VSRTQKRKASAEGANLDRITQSLLTEFVGEHDLHGTISANFEAFVAHLLLSSSLDDSFDVADMLTGGSQDLGIDAIAVVS